MVHPLSLQMSWVLAAGNNLLFRGAVQVRPLYSFGMVFTNGQVHRCRHIGHAA